MTDPTIVRPGQLLTFQLLADGDFAIGLIHEIDHLQNTRSTPKDPEAFFEEESRAWREVNLRFVRPLRELNEPMNPEFVQVDEVASTMR